MSAVEIGLIGGALTVLVLVVAGWATRKPK